MTSFKLISRKSWCRLFAMRVSALMLLVLVAGVVLGWKVNRVNTQKRVVERIERANGTIVYDDVFSDHRVSRYHKNRKPLWGPAWLRKQLGDEYFQEVTAVILSDDRATDDSLVELDKLDHLLKFELHGTKVTDAGLGHLERSRSLRIIELVDTQVTDAGLSHLKPLTGLRRIRIREKDVPIHELFFKDGKASVGEAGPLSYLAKSGELMRSRGKTISGAGLAHLAGLTQLQELDLSCPAIRVEDLSHLVRMRALEKLSITRDGINGTGLRFLKNMVAIRELDFGATDLNDDGLSQLAGLTRLQTLDLSYTPVTVKGLEHLKGLEQLEVLSLCGARGVTDDGLVWLKRLKSLHKLNLAGTMVTNDGLAHLSGLTQLQELDLSANEITDAGLLHLRTLHQLRSVRLGSTRVSDEAGVALKAAIPKLTVTLSQSPWLGPRPARKYRKAIRPKVSESAPPA